MEKGDSVRSYDSDSWHPQEKKSRRNIIEHMQQPQKNTQQQASPIATKYNSTPTNSSQPANQETRATRLKIDNQQNKRGFNRMGRAKQLQRLPEWPRWIGSEPPCTLR
eukprot:NODE_4326_length_478_cov_47.897436_g3716_i0.p1 GENE.NODE_4326_length_478_cov_47.897436_g3716_i0~~NODE_4326_length_478_cov_47.897436_g3716_i0.p1  ORF type:complete len:108 (+),score=22.69 NODE_4326_length_478_cov_47.897436_g3716_i0:138-461(+)